jgi:hypothetical protein
MSRVSSIIALLALALPSVSLAEWYAIRGEPTTTLRIQDNGKSIQVPVRKFDPRVTDLILRPDSEDAKRYWVEVTLVQWLDSGDGYLLAFGDVVLGEIYTRGDKWAIGFTSLDKARRCFQHLSKLHKLDADHARDTTKT